MNGAWFWFWPHAVLYVSSWWLGLYLVVLVATAMTARFFGLRTLSWAVFALIAQGWVINMWGLAEAHHWWEVAIPMVALISLAVFTARGRRRKRRPGAPEQPSPQVD